MKHRVKSSAFVLGMVLLFAFPVQAQDFLAKKVVEIGKEVPDFNLPDAAGKEYALLDLRGKIVMIHFWSTSCPFVKRYEDRLQQLTRDYTAQDVVVLGIDSNVSETVEDIQKAARERGVNYPVLVDRGNKIADDFGAITTPHVFILDKTGKLVYEGAVDDQGWSEDNPVTKNYAKDVLEALLSGSPVPHSTTKTFGCTVKRA